MAFIDNFYESLRIEFGQNTCKLFKQYVKINARIARLAARKIFLQNCRDNYVYPSHITNNLRCIYTSFNGNSKFIRKVDKTFSTFKIKLIILELEKTYNDIAHWDKKRAETFEWIKQNTPSNIHTSFLNCQISAYERDFKFAQKTVKKKFDNLYGLSNSISPSSASEEKWICNLSKHPIPKEVKAILNLGPKFAIKPTSAQIPYTQLICDVESIAQSFKLPDNRNLFRSKAVNVLTNSIIRPERLGQQDKYLNNLYTTTSKYLKQHKNEICVLESDKSKKTVIMDRVDYERITNDHIKSDTSYEKLTRDPTSTFQSKNNNLAKKLFEKRFIDKRTKMSLTTYTAICPRIYFLPKLHKLDPLNPTIDGLKMRPIVSGINSPTSELSHFVAKSIKASIDQEKYNIKALINSKT
jgi:hypothetical protein